MSSTREEDLLALRREILEDYRGIAECPAWTLNIDKKLCDMCRLATGHDIADRSVVRTMEYKGFLITFLASDCDGSIPFWYEIEGDKIEYSGADDGTPGYLFIEDAEREAKSTVDVLLTVANNVKEEQHKENKDD